tara:strand:- start:503 stop:1642 length:1140 start_codon:yes stop_codon:yes gene_type:complete
MNYVQKYEKLCQKYEPLNISCEICNHKNTFNFNNVGRISVAGSYGLLPIVICQNCSYTFQNPRYSDEFYKEYYKILYRQVAFGATEPRGSYLDLQKLRGKRVLDFLRDNNYLKTNSKVLDHGCAAGNSMISFEEENYSICGIDPHEPSVKLGNENGRNIFVAGGEDLPFKNNSLDLIISLGSLEHVYDLEISMKEIERVLPEGGILFARWRSDRIWGSPYEFYNHNHYRFFTIKTWELLLNKFNFKLIKYTYEEIEGLTGAAYIVAEKLSSNNSNRRDMNINFDAKEEIKKRVNNLKEIKESRFKYFQEFLNFAKDNGYDNEKIYNSINNPNNNLKTNFRLLFGFPEEVVPRAILEANRYKDAYSMDRKFSDDFSDYEI